MGTAHMFKGQDPWPLKMGPINCPETSMTSAAHTKVMEYWTCCLISGFCRELDGNCSHVQGSRSLAPEDGTDKLSRNVDDCSSAHTKVMEYW